LGALTIARRDPDALMFSLHSDHYVQHPEGFREGMLAAAEIASRNYLVTLGVHPSYPETGYGYIQRGDLLDRLRGLPVYRVQRFTEKPDEATAAQFVASGEYYWNTGMFTWRVSVILEEYARYLPDLTAQLNEIAPLIGTPRERSAFARVWPHVPVVTVDTGIAEKTARITVIPIDVGWSDVGSWATLLDLLPSDGNQNVVFGEHIGVDTSASLIYSSNRLIATVGLTDMIVVDTGDAILVCPKNRAQEVKHIVEQLKRNKKEKYL
jgi:mannose-1-phosphate guanylyltransferase